MKRRLFAIMLVCALFLGCIPSVSAANVAGFKDVSDDAWYANAVEYAVDHGLFTGTSATTFAPDAKMTRAMLVTVLHRHAGEPAEGKNVFSDVPGDAWYAKAVAWAAAKGIVLGTGDGTFKPEDNITREAAAAIMHRYAKTYGYELKETAKLTGFSDYAKVSSWAKSSMEWAVGNGMINGISGALAPQGNATRSQVATILMRFIIRCEDPLGKFLVEKGYKADARYWDADPSKFAILDIDQDGVYELIISSDYFGMGFCNFAVYRYNTGSGRVERVPVIHNAETQADQYYAGLSYSKEYKALVFNMVRSSYYGTHENYYVMDGGEMTMEYTMGWTSASGQEWDRAYFWETTAGRTLITKQEWQSRGDAQESVEFVNLP